VKQADGSLIDQVLTIRRTAHGPVFTIGGFTTAVRVNGIEINPIAGLPQQWWQMVRANNLDQFLDALRANQIPMLNTIYADKAKHTLLAYSSIIPVRSTGDYMFWNRPLPGDRSDLIWTQTHPFDSLPRVIDPPAGFVQNSNSTPWINRDGVAAIRQASLPRCCSCRRPMGRSKVTSARLSLRWSSSATS
jgi:acyl-homoserine-lactone acylase